MDEEQVIKALLHAAPGIRNGNVRIVSPVRCGLAVDVVRNCFSVCSSWVSDIFSFGVLVHSPRPRPIFFEYFSTAVASMVFFLYDWAISIDLEV